MAFGIPGSEKSSGEFLGRIQYDTRVGFWQTVKRAQDADGNWVDDKGEQFKNPTMLFDFATLEIGYIKFAVPPAFLVVPYGQSVPPQPQEMMADAQGKQRKSFLPGFRLKVASQKVFGDANAYYFAHNAKTVLEPMDELYQIYEQSPEAAMGKVPLVEVTGTRIVEVRSGQGTNRYHAPIFVIKAWYDRLPVFGDRLVPAPHATNNSVPVQPTRPVAPPPPPPPPVQPVVPPAASTGARTMAEEMPFGPMMD
jgi:hypothetical protein